MIAKRSKRECVPAITRYPKTERSAVERLSILMTRHDDLGDGTDGSHTVAAGKVPGKQYASGMEAKRGRNEAKRGGAMENSAHSLDGTCPCCKRHGNSALSCFIHRTFQEFMSLAADLKQTRSDEIRTRPLLQVM